MKKPTEHPAYRKRFQDLATRLEVLKKAHRIAEQQMWAGMLALNFSPDEIEILKDYFSPNDGKLLARIRGYIYVHSDTDSPLDADNVKRFGR